MWDFESNARISVVHMVADQLEKQLEYACSAYYAEKWRLAMVYLANSFELSLTMEIDFFSRMAYSQISLLNAICQVSLLSS
jgi:hypothetical protein